MIEDARWIPFILHIKKLCSKISHTTFVHDMLAATGPSMGRGNGAVGYFYRDAGMGLDSMAIPFVFFWEPVWSVPNAMTTLLTVGPKNNFTKWLPTPMGPHAQQ